MRVLGIDPGLTRCGWGVVDGRPGARPTAVGVGVVRSSPDLDLELRLLELHTAVTALMREHRPDVVAIERVFTQNNKGTATGTAQAAALTRVRRLTGLLSGVSLASGATESVMSVPWGAQHRADCTTIGAVLKARGWRTSASGTPRPCSIHGVGYAACLPSQRTDRGDASRISSVAATVVTRR